jgi:GAF domain-containing protein
MRERDEALEREKATAAVLGVISSSPGELQPVFDAIVAGGLRLFPGAAIMITLADGEQVKAVAAADPDRARAEALRRRFPIPLSREYMNGIAILDARMVDIPDAAKATPEMATGIRNFLASGYRAATHMPLLRGSGAIGVLSVNRLAPGPLTEKQIALLRTFAAQAVIAIENARLLNELRQRTNDLSKSLEQQTATSEVLQVISSSPGDLKPVFEAMLANAVRICEASFGMLFRFEGGAWGAVAMLGVPPAFAEFWQSGPQRPGPRTGLGRIAATRQSVHILDATTEPGYAEGEPVFLAAAKLGGFRTAAGVPMLARSSSTVRRCGPSPTSKSYW